MPPHPRHVLCVLGAWLDFEHVEAAAQAAGFEFDHEYSQLEHDERMQVAFQSSARPTDSTIEEADWDAIGSHTAVAYLLSHPMPADDAKEISGRALLLAAALFDKGALAIKSESAGLAHGRA